jgi:hypothetical protein
MKSPSFRAISVILVATGLIACQKERWAAGENVRARDVDVAAALGDTSQSNGEGLTAADVPAIPYPKSLRPCCAFGSHASIRTRSPRQGSSARERWRSLPASS